MSDHSEPLHRQVVDMVTSLWVSRVIYIAAKIGIADLLKDGAQSTDALAEATQTDSHSLYRALRMLACLGFFTETSPRHFSLTDLGATLCSDSDHPTRSTVLAMGGEWMWSAWGELHYSLKTGESGATKALGRNVFDYFADFPDEAKWFNDAMIGFHGPEHRAVANAYDFNGTQTVVDIGGGSGNMLTGILQANPQLKGVIFDLPHVVSDAKARMGTNSLKDRCEVVGGDFFEEVPSADAYILSHIIHDWDEEKCITILKNCRRANPKGKVLIVEMVLPLGDAPHPGKILDLVMLVCPGGQERTQDEYGQLLDKAGYEISRVVPTESPVSVIEAVPHQ